MPEPRLFQKKETLSSDTATKLRASQPHRQLKWAQWLSRGRHETANCEHPPEHCGSRPLPRGTLLPPQDPQGRILGISPSTPQTRSCSHLLVQLLREQMTTQATDTIRILVCERSSRPQTQTQTHGQSMAQVQPSCPQRGGEEREAFQAREQSPCG